MGSGLLGAIAGLAGPVAIRVLMALGLSVVTITGVKVAVDGLKSQAIAEFSAGPAAAVQLVGLVGGWQALGLLFGALTFAVGYWALTKATKLVFV